MGAGECTTPNFGAKRAVQSAPECTIGADSLVRSKRVGVPAVRIADAIKALPAGDLETPRFDSQWTARLVHVTAPDGFRLSVVGTPYGANRVPTAGSAEALFKIGGARISDTNDRNQPLGARPPGRWVCGTERAWSHPLARTAWRTAPNESPPEHCAIEYRDITGRSSVCRRLAACIITVAELHERRDFAPIREVASTAAIRRERRAFGVLASVVFEPVGS
jgi:hypothetical protein